MFERYENSTVYILGHDNIDIDSFISSILLSKLLSYKNINNRIVIVDKKIEQISYDFIKNVIGYDLNEYIVEENDIVGKNVILVDHHKTKYNVNVLGCIDHHPTKELFYYDFYINRTAGSCGRLIYDLMIQENYVFSVEDYHMIMYSVMVDTNGLRSTKYTEEDEEYMLMFYDILKLKREDIKSMIDKCIFPTDLTQTTDKIVKNGIKEYDIKGIKIKSSYIEVNNIPLIKINDYILFLQNYINPQNTDLWVFIVIDYYNNSTTIFKITKKHIKMEYHKALLSRGCNIMPKVEEEIYNNVIHSIL